MMSFTVPHRGILAKAGTFALLPVLQGGYRCCEEPEAHDCVAQV